MNTLSFPTTDGTLRRRCFTGTCFVDEYSQT